MNMRLLPFVDLVRIDFAMENGHEKPKQNSIKNSKRPIAKSGPAAAAAGPTGAGLCRQA